MKTPSRVPGRAAGAWRLAAGWIGAPACALGLLFAGGCEDGALVLDNGANRVQADTACPCDLAPGTTRTLSFAGRTWTVRKTANPQAAGSNCYAGDARSAWVDAQGRLHLRIVNRDGYWTCAEIYGEHGYGYGTYIFKVASAAGALDRNVVLGLFTWDNSAPALGTIYEIDIEFTTWSLAYGENVHYSVQPVMGPDTPNGQYPERTDSVFMGGDVTQSTHAFTWMPTRVSFASYQGSGTTGPVIGAWQFTNANPGRRVNDTDLATPVLIPVATPSTQVRLNLWLNDGDGNGFGDAPSDGREVEVVIEDFEFIPAG